MDAEVTIRPFAEQEAAHVRQLFITVNRLLSPPDLRYPQILSRKDFVTKSDLKMLFMVIERFRDNDMIPIYQRLRESGRSLPDGLEYVDSWIEPNFARCFQAMRCDDPRLFQEWVLQWRGFGVTFEIVPVVARKETQAVVARYLDPSGSYRDRDLQSEPV